jgi:exodeoxyribonuclease VII large subunit
MTTNNAETSLSLKAFLDQIKHVVEKNVVSPCWVKLEIANIQGAAASNGSGHLYIEAIEKDQSGTTVAKCRCMIWANQRVIIQRFEQATGMSLAKGLNLLVKVKVSFKADFGLSLFIDDIDPSFTLGLSELRLRQIRAMLIEKDVYHLNKQRPMPVDFHHVAVIAPADAAGLGDFNTLAHRLSDANLCQFHYFYCKFQGAELASTFKSAIKGAYDLFLSLNEQGAQLDALVIIRGGGDTAGLNELNNPSVAYAVCRFPCPVIVGIGHERDSVLIDELACVRCATPSLAIKHIEDVITSYYQRSVGLNDLANSCSQMLNNTHQLLVARQTHLEALGQLTLTTAQTNLETLRGHLSHFSHAVLDGIRLPQDMQASAIQVLDQAQKNLDALALHQQMAAELVCSQASASYKVLATELFYSNPLKPLKDGFSIVHVGHTPVITVDELSLGMSVSIRFNDGHAQAQITNLEKHDAINS